MRFQNASSLYIFFFVLVFVFYYIYQNVDGLYKESDNGDCVISKGVVFSGNAIQNAPSVVYKSSEDNGSAYQPFVTLGRGVNHKYQNSQSTSNSLTNKASYTVLKQTKNAETSSGVLPAANTVTYIRNSQNNDFQNSMTSIPALSLGDLKVDNNSLFASNMNAKEQPMSGNGQNSANGEVLRKASMDAPIRDDIFHLALLSIFYLLLKLYKNLSNKKSLL